MKEKKKNKSWIFLVIVAIIYLIILGLNQDDGIKILHFYFHLLKQVLPILVLVYFILLATNYFVDNSKIKKFMLHTSGLKIWFITIVAGILSVGPVYMWFPLLKELKEKGVHDRYLATFLYNRGIKIQWLPVLVFYFGLKYVLVLASVMTLFSIPQGILTEFFSKREEK